MRRLNEARHTFRAEQGDELTVGYDNRGEPYRQGISLWLETGEKYAGVFLEEDEARELRDLLNRIMPVKP
jgi:hypothetical protein